MQVRKLFLKKMLLPVDNQITGAQLSSWAPDGALRWVGLGHFDEIYTFSHELGSGLKYIQQCNDEIVTHNNEYEFFHSLFLIIPDEENEKKVENAFWRKNRWFLSVSRIHLSESGLPLKQFNDLAQIIRKDIEKTNSLFFIYHSIELSDMVLVLKSNCLSDILQQSLTLKKYEDVGRSYTYVGINKEKLLNEAFSDAEDEIPLFSMRFAVRKPDLAKTYIDQAISILENCTPYNIAGVDDVIVNCEPLKVCKLINLFSEWLSKDGDGGNLLRPFSEVTTRLGTSYNQANPNGDIPHKLYQECKELLELISSIKKHDTKRKYISLGWFNPLTEICNALVRMSHTSVMDEFVYLLLPGIKTFLRQIEHRVKFSNGNDGNEKVFDAFNILVNECSHLMEQIMRMEGQLAHQPELRPMVYDIPVFLLEYIMAFLKIVVPFLQREDQTPEVSIDFLIVPSLCEHIASLEIFNADPDAEIPGLVLVKVPVNVLYEPKTVLVSLCHETAHFAGEKIRNRDERKDLYILASAALIAENLFKSRSQELIKLLIKNLKKHLADYPQPKIATMQSEIQKFVRKIVDNESLYINYAWRSVNCTKKKGKVFFLTIDERKNAFAKFCTQASSLTVLFKDIYADICMYHLLHLSPDEYVNVVLTETLGKIVPPALDKRLCNFALRLYITLCVTEKRNCIEEITVKHEYHKLWSEMIAYIREITQKSHVQITALEEYAKKCNTDVEEMCKKGDISQIRDMYNLVKTDIDDYKCILECIQNSRSNE